MPGFQVIKLVPTQKFQLLILTEMLKNIDFLTLKFSDVAFILLIKFMRRINFMLN